VRKCAVARIYHFICSQSHRRNVRNLGGVGGVSGFGGADAISGERQHGQRRRSLQRERVETVYVTIERHKCNQKEKEQQKRHTLTGVCS
jgi:hypothetical protein